MALEFFPMKPLRKYFYKNVYKKKLGAGKAWESFSRIAKSGVFLDAENPYKSCWKWRILQPLANHYKTYCLFIDTFYDNLPKVDRKKPL